MLTRNALILIQVITIIMLLIALGDNPYGYYQILRWVVSGTLGYMAFLGYHKEQYLLVWIYGIIAVIFNPLAPIYLARDTWVIWNIIASGMIVISMIFGMRELLTNKNDKKLD